ARGRRRRGMAVTKERGSRVGSWAGGRCTSQRPNRLWVRLLAAGGAGWRYPWPTTCWRAVAIGTASPTEASLGLLVCVSSGSLSAKGMLGCYPLPRGGQHHGHEHGSDVQVV